MGANSSRQASKRDFSSPSYLPRICSHFRAAWSWRGIVCTACLVTHLGTSRGLSIDRLQTPAITRRRMSPTFAQRKEYEALQPRFPLLEVWLAKFAANTRGRAIRVLCYWWRSHERWPSWMNHFVHSSALDSGSGFLEQSLYQGGSLICLVPLARRMSSRVVIIT